MRIGTSGKLGASTGGQTEALPEQVWTRPVVPAPAVAPVRFEAPPEAATVVATAIGVAEGSRAAAAALACAGADGGKAPLFVDFGGRAPRPTLIASAPARALEERLAARLPAALVAARGQVCQLAVPADPDGFAVAAAAATVARGGLTVLHVPAAGLQDLLADPAAPRLTGALLRCDLGADRALLALVVRDLLQRDLAVAVLKRRLRWVSERRALFGALGAAGEGLSPGLVRRLTQYGEGYGDGGGLGS
ncbi:MAG: hypothetical protein JST31_10935 [Actinobacteria bacterium]|nr:hypothetical protein [Actinomycetota bacterium]